MCIDKTRDYAIKTPKGVSSVQRDELTQKTEPARQKPTDCMVTARKQCAKIYY